MEIVLTAIARVESPRAGLEDDGWGDVVSRIVLEPGMPGESLLGLDAFSHVEVVFHFHRIAEDDVTRGARHPRGNAAWPRVGILAQRGAPRPNRLGCTIAEVVAVEPRALVVRGLDAADGTPVLDVKPVMAEFLPRSPVRQPAWSTELMRAYWHAPD
ncbi:SAM-dependent methyltransferase [Longimicrobium sp.]|uniref:SAM-dependent methyltransferase n=1 Tax=Longimicrobium sp. TaxID=2029185 RepID=UPI002E37A3D5|nr:SAM-dependent methyltransferase [Longimicrobium sp.]HEX6039098.1 SAM-dependent methyltransferase [Longimicrobium sp.]